MVRLLAEVCPERSKDRGRGQYEKEQRDGLRDEDCGVAPGLDQRAPKVRFEGRTEDEGQNHWDRWEPIALKSEAQQAEGHHGADVKVAVVDGVSADDAEEKNDRTEARLRQAQELNREANGHESHESCEKIGQEQRCEEPVHEGRVLLEQERPRPEPLDRQCPKHHGRDGIAGNAKSEHGDQGAAGDAIVSTGRSGDALDGAVAKPLWMPRDPPLVVVRHKRRDGSAGAGDDPDDCPDDGRPIEGSEQRTDFLPARQHAR